MKNEDKTAKRLILLGALTFVISPLFAWAGVTASDETAVFASLSRLIWYSGSESRIFAAMLFMFIPMLTAFFLALDLNGMPNTQTSILKICMIVSCAVLYVGAMCIMAE